MEFGLDVRMFFGLRECHVMSLYFLCYVIKAEQKKLSG
jgi:hypothetical protein